MPDEIHVKGLAELQKLLGDLAPKLEANVLRSALRQGANVIKEEAQRISPVKSGKLRDSLKVGTRLKRGVATASVKSKVRYAALVEFGTKAHVIAARNGALALGGGFARAVRHPGARARPFLRPAFDSQARAAVIAVGNRIKEVLETKHGIDTAHVMVEGDE